MNIHEYQGKAVLKEFGVPVSNGRAIFKVEEAEAAAQGARRPALGREVADPCRRTRQGQVQGSRSRREGRRAPRQSRSTRSKHFVQRDARQHAGHHPDRTGRQAGQPPLYRGRLRHREGILPLDAGRPRDLAHLLRRLHRRRHGHRGRRARHAREDRHLLGRPRHRRHAAPRPPHRPGAGPHRRPRQAGREGRRASSTRPSSRRTWRCWRSTR